VERNYTNRNGDRDVDFINIVTWRGLAENCARHLGKGRLVGVDGSLQIRKSENNNRTYINPEVNADNVRFLDFGNNNGSRNNNQGQSQNNQNNRQQNNNQAQQNKKQEQDDFDAQFDDNFDADDFDVPF
jgi:single-strand DNA-binding protein